MELQIRNTTAAIRDRARVKSTATPVLLLMIMNFSALSAAF